MNDRTDRLLAENRRLRDSPDPPGEISDARIAGLRLYWSSHAYMDRLESDRAELLALLDRLAAVESEAASMRILLDRDPLCRPCFESRNAAVGLPVHWERADDYVASCASCGRDMG